MAMPVYAMSYFKLPKYTCEKITSAMSDFWWNTLENKRKIHWIEWDKLCLPKDVGGLGFKDVQLFNQALLAKQTWILLQDPGSIFSSFLKGRYFVDRTFLEAVIGSRPSFGWRILFMVGTSW